MFEQLLSKCTIVLVILASVLLLGACVPQSSAPPSLSMRVTPAVLLPTFTPPLKHSPIPTTAPTTTSTTIPPIRPTADSRLPQITHDLFFVSGNRLMRWNHATGQLEVLVAPGTRANLGGIDLSVFSVSDNNQKIALMHRKTVEDYEIGLYDMSTRVITSLVSFKYPLYYLIDMSVSPNGAWVAYISPGSLPRTGHGAGLAAPLPHPTTGGSPYGVIYAVRTNAPNTQIEVGFCSNDSKSFRGCMGFLWSPDSRRIVWSDARGVWLAELGQTPRLLVPYTIGVPPVQGSSTVKLQAWSPWGRYVLAKIGHSEGWIWGVIDLQTSQATELPDTLDYPRPGPQVTWMQDGRLFSIQPGNILSRILPSGEIWRVDSTHGLMLSRDAAFSITVGLENFTVAPTQLADGRLAFALLNADAFNDAERGLYFVEVGNLTPRKVNGLPPTGKAAEYANDADRFIFNTDVIWSSDGAGAVFDDRYKNTLLYVPTNGRPLFDLRPVLGGACCFTWAK